MSSVISLWKFTRIGHLSSSVHRIFQKYVNTWSRPLFSVVNWKCRCLSFDIKSFLLYVIFQVAFSDHVMDYLGWHQCFSLNIVSMDTLPCVWCFVWVIFRRSGTWQLYYEDVSSIPLPVHYCIAYWFSEWIYDLTRKHTNSFISSIRCRCLGWFFSAANMQSHCTPIYLCSRAFFKFSSLTLCQ